MDFYSTEKRNKLIHAAMDSYKYKDLPNASVKPLNLFMGIQAR